MEAVLEYETMCCETPPEHVLVGSLAEINQRKWQKWCVVHVTKNASATHFLALCPKPIAWFRWKRARLSLFRPQPHLPSFIQIHPSFRDLLAKTTFQIVTIVGDPIGIGSLIKTSRKVSKKCEGKREIFFRLWFVHTSCCCGSYYYFCCSNHQRFHLGDRALPGFTLEKSAGWTKTGWYSSSSSRSNSYYYYNYKMKTVYSHLVSISSFGLKSGFAGALLVCFADLTFDLSLISCLLSQNVIQCCVAVFTGC